MSALSSAVAILSWSLDVDGDFSTTEVSVGLGMPKSTASRLLNDMTAHRMLERDKGSGRYSVGPLLVQLGYRYRRGQPLIEAADAELEKLTMDSGFTTGISMLDGIHTVCLRTRAGHQPIQILMPPGSRVAAWGTSTGRSILALLPDEEIARRFKPFPKSSRPNMPSNLAELMRRIHSARQRGWDDSADEAVSGVGGISVAVQDAAGGEPIALYVAFSALHVNASQRREMRDALLAIKQRVLALYGGQPTRRRGATHG